MPFDAKTVSLVMRPPAIRHNFVISDLLDGGAE